MVIKGKIELIQQYFRKKDLENEWGKLGYTVRLQKEQERELIFLNIKSFLLRIHIAYVLFDLIPKITKISAGRSSKKQKQSSRGVL